MLKLGDISEKIKKVQKKLDIVENGIFDSEMDIIVRQWQESKGLVSDGIIGMRSWLMLFIDELEGIVPKNDFKDMNDIIFKFSINTPLRMSHFISQCHHESGGFRVKVENMNYSTRRLMEIFRKYFPTVESTIGYVGNPEKIGSKVYANRMGNGDERSMDGYRYRGRGYIQITGKNNYKLFGDSIGVDLIKDPDEILNYSLISAAWYFSYNNINRVSDLGNGLEVIKRVTKIINNGTNGLQDRINQFNKIYDILKYE